MKRMRIPVTRYGGVGHQEPAPVGRMKDLSGMSLEESIVAQWEAETRTLVPNWHFENGKIVLGNPRAGEPMTFEELPLYNISQRWDRLLGGTLAIEYILGVIPMDFFESMYENLPRDEVPTAWPITAVKKALGMGSYKISYNPGHPLPRPMPGATLLLDDLTFPDPRARLNPAYDPETGVLDLAKLAYDPRLELRPFGAGRFADPSLPTLHGILFFDMDGDGRCESEDDYRLQPPVFDLGEGPKSWYSVQLIREAEKRALFGDSRPAHMPTLAEAIEFWRYRDATGLVAKAVRKVPGVAVIVVASETDHVQIAPDHPHIRAQVNAFQKAGAQFIRLNPDRAYVEWLAISCVISRKTVVGFEIGFVWVCFFGA